MLTMGQLAYHESGHIIAAHHFGFVVLGATIRGNGDFGHTRIVQPVRPTQAQAHQLALVAVGGFSAECYFVADVCREISREDFDAARRLLTNQGENVDALLGELAREAVSIISAHRHEAEKIADLLIRKDTITQSDINQVVNNDWQ